MSHPTASSPDPDLAKVATWLLNRPDPVKKFGNVIRDCLDEVLDGGRTGRFDVGDLDDVEKAYLDTKFTIMLGAGLGLPRGLRTGHAIAGHDVESTFSLNQAWSVPAKAVGELCLDHVSRGGKCCAMIFVRG